MICVFGDENVREKSGTRSSTLDRHARERLDDPVTVPTEPANNDGADPSGSRSANCTGTNPADPSGAAATRSARKVRRQR